MRADLRTLVAFLVTATGLPADARHVRIRVIVPVSAAVNDANAATRSRAVPRLCRRSTFATPDADRSTPRACRCRSSDFGPNVGRAIASARITDTSSADIAFG